MFAKVNKLTDKNAVLEANVNKLTDKNAILVEKHQNIETENKILFEDKYIRDKFIIFGQAAALVRDNIAPAIRKESKGKIDWSDLEGEVLECADKQEPIADIYQTVLSNVKEKYAIAGRLDVPVLILLTTSRKNMFHRNIHTRTDVKLLLAEMEAFQFAHNDPAKELCKELIRIISVFKAEPMTKKTTKKLRRGTTSVNTAEL